jgi:hypothetical protein
MKQYRHVKNQITERVIKRLPERLVDAHGTKATESRKHKTERIRMTLIKFPGTPQFLQETFQQVHDFFT